LRHIENSIVLYKKEGNNGPNIVHQRTAPLGTPRHCADAQYWGRYGRCIVKGYPNTHSSCTVRCSCCRNAGIRLKRCFHKQRKATQE